MKKCLWCEGELLEILDLGSQPLANSLLRTSLEPEVTYPLIFCQCKSCHLSQVMRFDYEPFGADYPYFSSVNVPYVEQCAELAQRLLKELNPHSVLEIGCNDGYMLKHFSHLPHAGFEPSRGPYEKCVEKELLVFNSEFNFAGGIYDLILAFNVVPHTPNLRHMIRSMNKSLSPNGTVVIEVQDLGNLLKQGYFDTIYHEHYSYFELKTLAFCFSEEGLFIKKVERVSSHGGSLRVYLTHRDDGFVAIGPYSDFTQLAKQAETVKRKLRALVSYRMVCAFGAPAKGNTMLNFAGLKADDISVAYDETPAKQGKFLPGSRIPILPLEQLAETEADCCLILPWNFEAAVRPKITKLNPALQILTPFSLP